MLYEEDYLAWTQQQIGLLQTGKLEELDLKNLVEELKAMGRSDHRELESRLIILIAHLLKWEWQFNRLQNQWLMSLKGKVGEIRLRSRGFKLNF